MDVPGCIGTGGYGCVQMHVRMDLYGLIGNKERVCGCVQRGV